MSVSYSFPSVSDFQTYFARDFPYGSDTTTVMPSDITNALTDMQNTINQDLFQNQSAFTTAALNLAAHFLVLNLRASSQGIQGQWAWQQASKGVGSVSESFAIPEEISKNPMLAMYTKTFYGAKYIMFVYPLMRGNMFAVCAHPNP